MDKSNRERQLNEVELVKSMFAEEYVSPSAGEAVAAADAHLTFGVRLSRT
jgi:hypothetical protein